MKQLFFLYFTFLSKVDVASVKFNISSPHGNTNLPKKRSLHEKFLISEYAQIFHALLHSESHALEFRK